MKQKILNAILNCRMNYEKMQNSFSPIYSDFGLGLDSEFAGIRSLYMHYNRSTATLWEPLLKLNGDVTEYEPYADRVTYRTVYDKCEMAFYDIDSVFISCETQKSIALFAEKAKSLNDIWIQEKGNGFVILRGYSKNGDDRDPDKEVAVMAGLRVLTGTLSVDGCEISVSPVEGEIRLVLSFDVMNVSKEKLMERLFNAPYDIEAASQKTREWILQTIKDLNLKISDDEQSTVFLKSIITLIFNLAKAPGNLEGAISSFPNRGGYPTHFMWDSCFQNLAYEMMNLELAKDSLLQLCNNIRPDGKIPQFLCSTWGRPHDAQPALLGWAAKRVFEKESDIEFAEKIFEALEKNNTWWLTQRMTRFGVIKCADGLETGQDNSPRFDNGTVLAVDMNSYLLNQIKTTAYFARVLGYEKKAEYWDAQASALNEKMIEYLYDEDKNMFFDADADTGFKQKLLTTSGFIPLWAGVEISREKAYSMIKDWLLNPEYFFSDVPFPSVAYTESVYDPRDWWRGPTWMPEAWLMLEILEQYGFELEYKEGMEKLYNVLLNDGVLHELFNSQTGEGMGNLEQGWTAAIFMKMYSMLN